MSKEDEVAGDSQRSPLAQLNHVLGLAEWGFIGGALALTSVLLFVNVVMRYVFRIPLNWVEETSLYLMVWIVFVGGSIAIRTRGHMAIDLLPLALSPPNRRLLALVVALASLVFFAVFFWYSLEHTLRVLSINQLTPVMQAPMWLTYLAMPVGSLLMALRTIQSIVHTLKTEDFSVASIPSDLQD